MYNLIKERKKSEDFAGIISRELTRVFHTGAAFTENLSFARVWIFGQIRD